MKGSPGTLMRMTNAGRPQVGAAGEGDAEI
jgi:hypothetical protein